MDNLTDLEIKKIEVFCGDKEMSDAVKKVLLADLYSHGVIEKGKKHDPLKNGAFSLASLAINNPIPDEQLGQHIRSMWAGINALENGFNKLNNIKSKKVEKEEKKVNIAE